MFVKKLSRRLFERRPGFRAGLLEGLESRVLLSVVHSDADIHDTWTLVGTGADGTAQFDGAGNVTGGSVTDDSGTNSPSGTYTVDGSGALSITVGDTSAGAINARNDVAAFSEVTGNHFNVIVSGRSASFSTADLSGTWTIAFNGDAPDSNGAGTLVFNGAGLITGGTLMQGNSQTGVGTTTTHVAGGNYTISSIGAVTITVTTIETSGNHTSTFTGAMNASKDVLVLDPPDIQTAVANTDSTLLTLIHSVGKYTNADAAGTWTIVGQNTIGSITLDGAGHISGGTLNSSGNTFALSGTYSVAASGTYTLNTVSTGTGASVGNNLTLTFTGAINGSRNVMAMNSVDATSSDNLTILINSNTVDHAPTMTTVAPFATATELHAFTISYSQLLGSSNAADVDGDPISFLITSVGSGTLTVNGSAVVAGTTTVSAGQTISWTPAAGTKGAVSPFSVEASDGTLTSSKAVAVKVNTVLLPSITIAANKSKAAEGNPGVAGQFTLTRTGGDMTQTLTVDYGISGTATNGAGYQTLSGNVTFAANSKTATVDLTPIDSVLTEGSQTATLTISPSGGNVYTVGSKPTATVTITDHQLSPAVLSGDTLNLVVGAGTAPFATAGAYQLILSPSDSSYLLVGGTAVPSSSGTYTYTKTGSATGSVTFTDSSLGSFHGTLTFTAATAATFSFAQDSGNGTQSGGLKLVPPPAVSVAPASLSGRTMTMKITAGTGNFQSAGTYEVILSAASNNYVIVGTPPIANSHGTYTYEKFSSGAGVLVLTDSGASTMDILFKTATSGAFVLTAPSGSVQTGTMTLAPAAKIFAPASLNGHTLTDVISSKSDNAHATGSYLFVFAANTFTVVPIKDATASTGTYSIELFNPATLVITENDSIKGTGWGVFTFTSSTKASYILVNDSDGKWQRGAAALS